MGTPEEFRRMLDTAKDFGWLIALHENYNGLFREHRVWGDGRRVRCPDFDEKDAAKNADLSLKGDKEKGTFALAVDKELNYLEKQAPLTEKDYDPNAAYLDVDTAWLSSWSLDLDAGNPAPKSVAFLVEARKKVFDRARQVYGGPLLGEGGQGYNRHDTYYAGYVDGVERQIEGGYRAPIMPDYELRIIKPLMANQGVGYHGRYLPKGNAGEARSDAEWDLIRATEIAYGHTGFLPDTHPWEAEWPQAFAEYYLLQGLQSRYLTARPLRVLYRDGDRWLTLNEALQRGLDFVNVKLRIEYDDGLVIYINHTGVEFKYGEGGRLLEARYDNEDPWPVKVDGRTFILPPNGWAARAPDGFLAYSALVGGRRGDYARTPDYVFARSRDGHKLTLEGLTTDGAVALKPREGYREVHLVQGSLVMERGRPVLKLSARADANLTYPDPRTLRLKVSKLEPHHGTVDVEYYELPWDVEEVRVWLLDEQGKRHEWARVPVQGKAIRLRGIVPEFAYLINPVSR